MILPNSYLTPWLIHYAVSGHGALPSASTARCCLQLSVGMVTVPSHAGLWADHRPGATGWNAGAFPICILKINTYKHQFTIWILEISHFL